MDDRELLKRAATAAGIELIESPNGTLIQRDNETDFARMVNNRHNGGFPETFDPLTFDHQAFRLAVKLNLQTTVEDDRCGAVSVAWGNDFDQYVTEESASPEAATAATRRAIVRAASKIAEAKS